MNSNGFGAIQSWGRGSLSGRKRGEAIVRAARSVVEALESRCLLSAVMGTVYMDSNGNGAFDEGEPGIEGVVVSLADASGTVASTETASDGSYWLFDIPAGQYVLSETQPSGYFDAAGSPNSVSLAVPENVLSAGNNFGELIPSSLAGFVYVDANDDGVRDAGEAGIPGVTITLTGTDDQGAGVLQQATTDADGLYSFFMLRPGTYAISEAQPAGYADGRDTGGCQGCTVGNDVFSNIQVGAGMDGAENNFGELPIVATPATATLGGHTFNDLTGDGLTADDTAMANVRVWLYADRNSNGILDRGDGEALTSVLSGVGGDYAFADVAPGQYLVKASTPRGYVRTAPTLADYYAVDVATGGSMGNLDFASAKLADRSALANVRYVINGKRTVYELRGQVKPGDWVQVSFTVLKGHTVTLSLVSYTAPSSHFVAAQASQQQVYQSQTKTFGPGTYKLAMGVYVPKGNFQVDFVFGGALQQFGPARSHIFYSPQHRLISADNGGPVLKLHGCGRK